MDETVKQDLIDQLRGLLERLESACNELATSRSQSTYFTIMTESGKQRLIDLDDARKDARKALADTRSLPGLLDTIESQAREIERLNVLATKVDAIRDSIIGCQRVNWSEHVYPLVAALGEAGFEGQEYEAARDNVGTLIERTNAAETERDRLKEALEPSGETKVAYIGEVKDRICTRDEDGEEVWHDHVISWDATKAIMKMIAARAALHIRDGE
jgi:hypothetical protein